jgi:RNA 3'-terminal phosphate cyclase
MSPALSRDFGRLRDALELLQRGRKPEGRGYFRAAVEAEERARLRRAAEAEEEEEARCGAVECGLPRRGQIGGWRHLACRLGLFGAH